MCAATFKYGISERSLKRFYPIRQSIITVYFVAVADAAPIFRTIWAKCFHVVWKVFAWILCRNNISLDRKKTNEQIYMNYAFDFCHTILHLLWIWMCICCHQKQNVLAFFSLFRSVFVFFFIPLQLSIHNRHNIMAWWDYAKAASTKNVPNSHCECDFLVAQSFPF